MSIEFKNVKVTWSTMLRKLTPELNSKEFCFEVPADCEEIQKLRGDFEALEEKAKQHFSEKEGKKVKGASREAGVGEYLFGEENKNGNRRLKFIVFNVRENKETKQKEEVLASIYNQNPYFCYKVDNNGAKQYEVNGKPWFPNSNDVINIKCSLLANYNKSAGRITIKLKADEVEIVSSNYSKKSGSSFGYLSLDNEEEEFVPQAKIVSTPKETPKAKEKDEEIFSAEDLASLDI